MKKAREYFLSDSLENEKQFFESLDDSLSQFYKDSDADLDEGSHSLYNFLKENKDRFSQENFFASGATKKVFSVQESSTERKIALARPHKTDEKTAESFLREARRTSLLEHPNIVRIYDVGVDEHGPWFTMELIEGDSLEQKIAYLKDGGEEWNLYERLEIFNKVCDAMTYAHSIGILHLDIKPDNIRIGEFGEILLCDWGLSFLDYSDDDHNAELSNDQTLHGVLKGTPGYMAPERMKGEKSVQSDIFSLGALLYTLFTYEPPFRGKSVEETLKATLDGKVDFPESPKVPERLEPVIRKALTGDLKERYQSVKEFQDEIGKFRAGFATTAEEPSLFTQIKLFYSRNRFVCHLVMAFLIIIITLTYKHIQAIESKQKELVLEKQKTEEAFELYRSEERARDEILNLLSSNLINQSRFDLDSFNVDRSLKKLNKALDKDPENQEVLMQLGFVHFIRNNFKLASYFFDQTNFGKVEDLKAISHKYHDVEELLPAQELIEIIKQLRRVKRQNLYLYMYTYYVKKQKDYQQVVELTKFLIEKRNKLEEMNFDYNKSDKALSMSNNRGLKSLLSISGNSIQDFCLLRYLDVEHLDLSNTGFKSLSDLEKLKVSSLNLKNTAVENLEFLKSIPSLRKLILSEKQRSLVKSDYHFEITFE